MRFWPKLTTLSNNINKNLSKVLIPLLFNNVFKNK